MAEYITYSQLDLLLRSYPLLTALLKNLKTEVQTLYIKGVLEKDEDVILAMILGNRKLDGMPLPTQGNVQDKTGNVALRYKDAINKVQADVPKEIISDIINLNHALDKVESAINGLTSSQQKIVRLLYFEKRTWAQIIIELNDPMVDTPKKARKEKNDSLSEILRVLRIDKNLYDEILNKI